LTNYKIDTGSLVIPDRNFAQKCPFCSESINKPPLLKEYVRSSTCEHCSMPLERQGEFWLGNDTAHEEYLAKAYKAQQAAAKYTDEMIITCPSCQKIRNAPPKKFASSTCPSCKTTVYRKGKKWTQDTPRRVEGQDTLSIIGLIVVVGVGYFLAEALELTEIGKLLSYVDYGGLFFGLLVMNMALSAFVSDNKSVLFTIFAITFMIAFNMQDLPRGWSPGQFSSEKFLAELDLRSLPSLPGFGGGTDVEDIKDEQIEIAEQASRQGNYKKASAAYGIAASAAGSSGDLDALEALLSKQVNERNKR